MRNIFQKNPFSDFKTVPEKESKKIENKTKY